jgi:hypothetical protein
MRAPYGRSRAAVAGGIVRKAGLARAVSVEIADGYYEYWHIQTFGQVGSPETAFYIHSCETTARGPSQQKKGFVLVQEVAALVHLVPWVRFAACLAAV